MLGAELGHGGWIRSEGAVKKDHHLLIHEGATHDLRVVRVEVLFELMAGARGDFVNTWANRGT